MPRLTRRLPRLCEHKGTGQAVVYLGGKAHYCGPIGSAESKARYQALVANWIATRDSPAGPTIRPPAPTGTPTLNEVILRFKTHAESYYRGSREAENLRDAIRPLRVLFGRLKAEEFGPFHLRRVREAMIADGLARKTINARINRIRRLVKWAVAEGLLEPAALERLRSVEPLRPGRGGRETARVRPVAWADVQAVLPHLTPLVQGMVLFGWYTGARPGELIRLTTRMIDRSADVWIATLPDHKCAWRDQTRQILIGPKARAVLEPWLLPDRPDDPVFNPRRADLRQPKRRGRRRPGRAYSRSAFAQAVRRACKRAGVPPWGPNALRHAAATRLREEHGIEVAQQALGHARPDTTLIYSSAAKARAIEAIRITG
jgi:integrase